MKQESQQELRLRRARYRVAAELGLLEKVLKEGWSGLTSRENGRIGGIISRRLRNQQR